MPSAGTRTSLLGWLRLRGRCAACGTRISARYPLVELVTGLLFAGLAWRMGPQPAVLLWCGVAATLVALTAIDWDTTLLPDSLTLPLLWAGLCRRPGLDLAGDPVHRRRGGGYLSLWSVYWLFKLTTGKEGMGAATSSCWPRWAPGWAGRPSCPSC
jgi:leader peptidase (prepilin peptidase)/N-methyltransferase